MRRRQGLGEKAIPHTGPLKSQSHSVLGLRVNRALRSLRHDLTYLTDYLPPFVSLAKKVCRTAKAVKPATPAHGHQCMSSRSVKADGRNCKIGLTVSACESVWTA